MCTSIIEIVRAEGMAKRGDEWFPLSQTVVAYDHARHAPLGDVITLDFINAGLDPGSRAGIELTLEKAKELRAALGRAIGGAEFRSRKCGARASCSASFQPRDELAARSFWAGARVLRTVGPPGPIHARE